jgi:hypothetical protein
LCPPQDTNNGPQCPRGQSGQVRFQGVNVNFIAGAGWTLGVGRYQSDQGNGWYFRFGAGTGFDLSVGTEGGASDNLDAFSGDGEGYCVGVSAANGCHGSNKAGSTTSGGGALGPSELLVSGHAEKTATVISMPKKQEVVTNPTAWIAEHVTPIDRLRRP